MNECWKSWTGGALVTVYLILAGILFHKAFTCTGWVCDLVALPAIFPLGFPAAWLIDWIDSIFPIPGHTPTFHMRSWYFIVPTVSANAIFYYWLGRQLERLAGRLFQRFMRRQ